MQDSDKKNDLKGWILSLVRTGSHSRLFRKKILRFMLQEGA